MSPSKQHSVKSTTSDPSAVVTSADTSLVVVQQTDTELVMHSRRSPGWILGLVFLTVGSFWILNIRSTRLTCRRVEPTRANCELAEFKLFGQLKVKTTTLKALQEATIESKIEPGHSESGPYEVYRINLSTPQGIENLTPYFISNRAKAIAIANNINHFLKTPQQPSLIVAGKDSESLVGGIFGLLATLSFCALTIVGYSRVICTFNKGTGQAAIIHKGGFGKNAPPFEFLIGDIKNIVIEQYDNEHFFRISFQLKNGQRKPPFAQYYGYGLARKQQSVKIIESFLGLNVNGNE